MSAVTRPESDAVELKSIMARSPRQVIFQVRESVGLGRRQAANRWITGGLVMLDHRLRVAGDDGINHAQRFLLE